MEKILAILKLLKLLKSVFEDGKVTKEEWLEVAATIEDYIDNQ